MKKQQYQTKRMETFHRVERAVLPALSLLALTVFFPSMKALALDQTWGPERETFTWQEPASYRTFNSMTDNPDMGDERNFVRVREAGSGNKWRDNVTVEPGKEYEVYIYYHNNAAANLNESGKGIANNVKVKSSFPEKLTKGDSGIIRGTITASNTNPTSVWDTAFFNANETVFMRYVANSAVIHNTGTTNGTILSGDALLSDEGVAIGHWADHWGIVPGCNEYAGHIIYRVKADKPGFFIQKTASTAGANSYGSSVSTLPGSTIDFKITYKNTGTTIQNNVTVYDRMPDGMKFVPGTVFVVTDDVPEGKFVSDSMFDGGLNIGGFKAGETATITYKATLEDNTALFPCGQTIIYNNSSVATTNGTEYDKVEIKVNRTCDTITEIPETGPAEVVLAVVVISGIGIGIAYWIRSKVMLNKITKTENGDKAGDK